MVGGSGGAAAPNGSASAEWDEPLSQSFRDADAFRVTQDAAGAAVAPSVGPALLSGAFDVLTDDDGHPIDRAALAALDAWFFGTSGDVQTSAAAADQDERPMPYFWIGGRSRNADAAPGPNTGPREVLVEPEAASRPAPSAEAMSGEPDAVVAVGEPAEPAAPVPSPSGPGLESVGTAPLPPVEDVTDDSASIAPPAVSLGVPPVEASPEDGGGTPVATPVDQLSLSEPVPAPETAPAVEFGTEVYASGPTAAPVEELPSEEPAHQPESPPVAEPPLTESAAAPVAVPLDHLFGPHAGPVAMSLVDMFAVPDSEVARGELGGFTCTGMDRNADGSWILASDGRTAIGDRTFEPSIEFLDADFSTSIGHIALKPLYEGIESVQGICRDPGDGTLWFVDKANAAIRHIGLDGTPLRDEDIYVSGIKPNGLAYDGTRGGLWVSAEGENKAYCVSTADGSILDTVTIRADADHLFYDATFDRLYFSFGANGHEGTVAAVDLSTDSTIGAFMRLEKAQAIEAIFIDGNDLYVANDAGFHTNAFPLVNAVLHYQLTDIADDTAASPGDGERPTFGQMELFSPPIVHQDDFPL